MLIPRALRTVPTRRVSSFSGVSRSLKAIVAHAMAAKAGGGKRAARGPAGAVPSAPGEGNGEQPGDPAVLHTVGRVAT